MPSYLKVLAVIFLDGVASVTNHQHSGLEAISVLTMLCIEWRYPSSALAMGKLTWRSPV
jgi:hypothetical protein